MNFCAPLFFSIVLIYIGTCRSFMLKDYSLSSTPMVKKWDYGLVYYEISHNLFRHQNYIYIDIGDSCNSHVGMIGGKQLLTLNGRCLNKGDIMHEVMHALGFLHEHQRPDRDDYLLILCDNVQHGKLNNFDLIPSEYYENLDRRPFDYESIMIYGEYAFSKNGLPTMLPTTFTSNILTNPSEKSKLSSLDIKSLEQMYECYYFKNMI
ncbi:hypothetical protein RDWZM_002708 [Blomia tropicalis]|uniref:Metalloendopeptidase n=1 Tax=Blomia tropicalis TaxID=40697 RepID=A0A9Q0MDA8_BLOTA|nr:hypothetical protein RDWZM_002708 [Blomia tropicalis]